MFPARRVSIPRLIWLITGVHLAIGLSIYVECLITGDFRWVDFFFGYQGPIYFVAFAGVQLALSISAWKQFSAGDPLRGAWLCIALAAGCHLVAAVFAHLLGVNSQLNPLFLADRWGQETATSLRQFGLMTGGPLQMGLLACGLLLVLRAYRELRLLAKLTAVDFLLLGIVLLYTLYSSYEAVTGQLDSSAPASVYSLTNLANDPLLSLLLLEAVFIRRSVINMGRGLIAKCWGAFTAAIFLTSIGDIGLWATAHEFVPWPYSGLTWYVWFLASTAYALGPAYQVEASLRAKREVRRLATADLWRFPSGVERNRA